MIAYSDKIGIQALMYVYIESRSREYVELRYITSVGSHFWSTIPFQFIKASSLVHHKPLRGKYIYIYIFTYIYIYIYIEEWRYSTTLPSP